MSDRQHELNILSLLGVEPSEAAHINVDTYQGVVFYYDSHMTADQMRKVADYLDTIGTNNERMGPRQGS